MSADEARFLVDFYYISQEDRKRAHNQVRSMKEEPHVLISWVAKNSEVIENQVKRALDEYTDAHTASIWMKSLYGVGPVIAAGMLAHIDIKRARTVGNIYSFAGIAGQAKCRTCGWPWDMKSDTCPNCEATDDFYSAGGQKLWSKGEKRPYNASLKTLCWKVGQSFMKFSGHEECTYGTIYKARKEYEVRRNDRGDNATQAKQILTVKTFKKNTEAYAHLTAGHLPPAQIDGRARRYATKIFLSHMHCVMHWLEYNKLPPNPYALEHGHAHFIHMPNIEMVSGLGDALRSAGLM